MLISSVKSLFESAERALKAAYRNRAIRYGVLALIFVDALLLLGVVAYAIVEHFNITSSYLYGMKSFFSTADWSLFEIACYLKEAACVVMLGWIALRTRSTLFGALTFFVAAVLADDSLRFHETMGRSLATGGVFGSFSEVIASVIYGVIPVILLLWTWINEGRERRRDALPIIGALGLLLFFAIFVDAVRHLAREIITGGNTIAALFEDGGELLSLTLLVAIVAGTWSQLSAGVAVQPGAKDY